MRRQVPALHPELPSRPRSGSWQFRADSHAQIAGRLQAAPAIKRALILDLHPFQLVVLYADYAYGNDGHRSRRSSILLMSSKMCAKTRTPRCERRVEFMTKFFSMPNS